MRMKNVTNTMTSVIVITSDQAAIAVCDLPVVAERESNPSSAPKPRQPSHPIKDRLCAQRRESTRVGDGLLAKTGMPVIRAVLNISESSPQPQSTRRLSRREGFAQSCGDCYRLTLVLPIRF